MNILYLGPAQADYQSDMLLHGLLSSGTHTILDYPRQDRMYSDYADLSSLYGRGFTLYGLLQPDPTVDRSAIPSLIQARAFDLIIYGSITRAVPFLRQVRDTYPPEKIIHIDGEDHATILPELAERSIYFKRELAAPVPNVFPIHFAIPSAKIGTLSHMRKTRVRAFIDPRDRTTYIYKDEASYYADYATALFAFTTRKAGWDCLRHYEILANGCIPLFLDLENCPATTLMNLPKTELLEALTLADRDGSYWDTPEGIARWASLHRRIHLKFSASSTTERLAQYVLETQAQEAARAA